MFIGRAVGVELQNDMLSSSFRLFHQMLKVAHVAELFVDVGEVDDVS